MRYLLSSKFFKSSSIIILFSLAIYVVVINIYSPEQLQIIRLTQVYALTALFSIYIALIIEPICNRFKNFPNRKQYLGVKKSFWLATFYFGILHSSLAFFGQLGGFEGLGFLSSKYLIAISIAFTALVMLFIMTLTLLNWLKNKFSFLTSDKLDGLLYFVGILILTHALLLGTHFENLIGFVPQIVFIGLVFLLVLEAIRFDEWARKKFKSYPNFGYASVLVMGSILTILVYFFLPVSSDKGFNFGIHSQHIQIARSSQSLSGKDNQLKMPGLQGDRTRRFTVDYEFPERIEPNVDTALSFKIYDASSGNQIRLFNKIYGKVVHFIIVDSSLNYFSHIHPEYKDGEFSITTQFPKNGQYHVYADFQPLGAIEQRIAGTLNVGEISKPVLSNLIPDNQLTKNFGDYEVTLNYPKPLVSSKISIGQQLLEFTIRNVQTKKPIATLKPYLEAFGHMVMINQKTFDYIHVHPNDTRIPKPGQNGGPTVEFMPLGLYGPIKPGIYRVFTQFNPDDNLFTSDFTIEIK